jgi:Zn-dependent M28 family amino/carboxypeptidase
MLSRARETPLTIPAIYAAPAVGEALRKADGPVRMQFAASIDAGSTSNIIGVFGAPLQPGVLLSAHWDGVGVVDGAATAGASDNAAGVAVVLWVADQLRRDAEAGRLKKPVIVALFGGEEAGLLGSRQFAAVLGSPRSPLAKPVAAINVDGLGGGLDRTVYVIGRSHHPDLFELVQPLLAREELPLGRDIDRFAFPRGSDHWPLHEAGIPAITLFGTDYRAMNGPADTLDKVDVGMLRMVARAVYRSIRELAK